MPGNGQEFGPCTFCGEFHAEDVLMCPRAEKLLPLEGRLLDGKFRFTRRLGEGGMGAVWQCENILVRKTVAIKLMHIQYSRDEGTLARFRNEATAAGRIGSRHICDILDLGTSVLGPYIVMEMLRGSDFGAYVQKHHPVQVGLVVMVIRQALLGLKAAHDAGIVHRDLKPENIFMHQPEPGRLLVKLMDFGISKFSEGSEAGKTGLGVLMGTPEYMSPEQSEGAAKVDVRTDIWAIGVILYWALSGTNPFLGQTLAQTLMNVGMREAPPLVSVVPHVPQGLSAIVERCLAKAPHQRWQSALELWTVLEPYEQTEGLPFVAYGQASASTATPSPAAFTPTPGGTVKAVTPHPYPTPMPPSAHGSGRLPASAPTPAGPETFSNEITGPLHTTAHTLEGSSWTAASVVEERPHSNIQGGGIGLYIGLGIAGLLVLGGGVYAISSGGGDGDRTADTAEPDVANAGGGTTGTAVGAVGTTTGASGTESAGTESAGTTAAAAASSTTGAAAGADAPPHDGADEANDDGAVAKDEDEDSGSGKSSGSTKGSSTKGSGSSTKGSGSSTKGSGSSTKGSGSSTKGNGSSTKGGSSKPVLRPSKPPREASSKLPS